MNAPAQPYDYRYGFPPGYSASGKRRHVGIAGAVISSIGAVIAIAGLFLNWYSASGFDVDLRLITAGADASNDDLVKLTFGWGLWAALGLTIVVALLGNIPGPVSMLCRILAPLFALGFVALTLGSLYQLRPDVSVFENAAIGLFAVLGGAVIIGIGGVIGPRRG